MASSADSGSASSTRTEVTCTKCGKATTVPFVPTPGRPVFCRDCFASQPQRPMGGGGGGGRGGGGGGGGGPMRRFEPRTQGTIPRQRMMAQGRKGHFMYDAREVMARNSGSMDDSHVRAFLEGLFARGARTNTQAAQEFLDEKLADQTITPEQRDALGRLVERYSFWR